MSKRIIRVFVVLGAVFILSDMGVLIYKQIAKTIRYDTPVESFEKSSPFGSELIDILEVDNFALVVYKKRNNASTFQVIAENDSKWDSMVVEYKNIKLLKAKNSIVDITYIDGKYIIILTVISEENESVQVRDSLNTEFNMISYDSAEDKYLSFFLGVVAEDSIQDYKIWINNEELTVFYDEILSFGVFCFHKY